MQTRSMTRRALSRASSLDSRAPSPSRAGQPETSVVDNAPANQAPNPVANATTPDPIIEVVTSDLVVVEHAANAALVTQNQQEVAQRQMLSIIQAQAMVQAESHRHTEARLHQAFAQTEARLHATAQAVVQAHANEQALETRRSLEEAIQHALVDAHTRAHEQAMQAAHDRLTRFTKEISEKIQKQLAEAVNEVGTKGAAYIEGVTTERLSLLRNQAQVDIEKSVQQALATYSPPDTKPFAGDAENLRRQILTMQSELLTQLAESEKRCHDGAVATASAQAERIVSKAEGRLVSTIETRMIDMENRVESVLHDAVVRAETHCTVVEKRARESIERTVGEFCASKTKPFDAEQQSIAELEANVTRSLEKKIDASWSQFVSKQIQPMLENLVGAAVQAQMTALVDGELSTRLTRHFEIKQEPRVRAIAVETAQQLMDNQMVSKFAPRVRSIVAEAVPDLIDSKLSAQLGARVRAMIEESAPDLINSQLNHKLATRVRAVVAEVVPELIGTELASKLPSRVRAIIGETAPDLIDDQLAIKLPSRVRALVGDIKAAPVGDDSLLDAKMQERLRGIARDVCVKIVEQQLAEKLRTHVDAAVAAVTNQRVEQQIDTVFHPLVQRSVQEATAHLRAAGDCQVRHGSIASVPFHPVCACSSPCIRTGQSSLGDHSNPAAPRTMPAQVERDITEALAKTYGSKRTDNQVQHRHDDESSTVWNARAILVSRERAHATTTANTTRQVNPERPSKLSALNSDALKQFVAEYQRYRKRGGTESWTEFSTPSLVGYLRSVECPDGFSDEQIFRHLVKKVQDSSRDVAVLEKKFCDIKIDPHAGSSKEKVESILVGVESVLLEITATANNDTRAIMPVPLATLITIVTEKLPRELQALVERRLKFMAPLQDKREFAKVLLEEAAHFTWPAAASVIPFKRQDKH